jgi:hypothetical protein
MKQIIGLAALVLPALCTMTVQGLAQHDPGHFSLEFHTSESDLQSTCALATISADGKVTIDWGCVDRSAAKYNTENFTKKPAMTGDLETDMILAESARTGNMMTGFAYVLKSLHAGTAQ